MNETDEKAQTLNERVRHFMQHGVPKAYTERTRQGPMRLSAAKHAVGMYGQSVAEECIQLHGGIGMTWELEAAHYAKRLVLLDHYFGNADHHLSRVMAAI